MEAPRRPSCASALKSGAACRHNGKFGKRKKPVETDQNQNHGDFEHSHEAGSLGPGPLLLLNADFAAALFHGRSGAARTLTAEFCSRRSKADEIVPGGAGKETDDQARFCGKCRDVQAARVRRVIEHMEQLGLKDWHEATRKAQPKLLEELRALGRELGWPKPKNSHSALPSMRYIAVQGGHERLYDYLYFATSKTVHFNAHELTRRVWGKSPGYNWDAPYFRDFWSLFSLVWAARMLLLSCIECKDLVDQAPDVSHEGFGPALEMVSKYAYIPIITSREFMRPDHPRYAVTMEHLERRKSGMRDDLKEKGPK